MLLKTGTEQKYRWRVGDVFTKGESRWRVDRVLRDGLLAVLRSCGSSWATTNALTFEEWNDDGQWVLESAQEEEGGN